MRNIKSIIALPLVAVLLSGCIGTKNYKEEEYILETNWSGEEDYRILQLGDIHLSQSDNHEEHFKVIDRTVKAANPNMIVLNGDIFTYADKHVVKKVFNFFDSYNIPWTYTFGNHDDQGYYADNYIQRLLGGDTYKNVLYKNLEDDDVTGRCNFVINLKSGSKVEYQVYCLDSHNYNFDTMEYDIIKQDQIDWYDRMVKYSTGAYGGLVKSSMFIHIAFPEFVENWQKAKEERDDVMLGDMEEGLGSPSQDLHFFDKIKELGSTQSVHANHDHANDAVILREGVYLCYGVHSTNRIYNDKETRKIGGSLIKVNKATKKLTFENYYTSYDSEEMSVETYEGGAK